MMQTLAILAGATSLVGGAAGGASAGGGFVMEAPKCDYALQLMWVQDASGSYQPHVNNMKAIFPPLIEELEIHYPGSHYMLNSFVDQGYWPLGCLDTDTPFRKETEWSNSSEEIVKALDKVKWGWGVDYPESQLIAMAEAGNKKMFMEEQMSPSGRPFKRFLVISTDEEYHTAGYAKLIDKAYYNSCHIDGDKYGHDKDRCCPVAFDEWTIKDYDPNGQLHFPVPGGEAVVTDYPTIRQTAEALAGEDVNVIVLKAAPTLYGQPIESRVQSTFDKYDKDLREVFEEYGIAITVVEMEEDSSNLREAILEGLKDLEEAVCEFTTRVPTEGPKTTEGGVVPPPLVTSDPEEPTEPVAHPTEPAVDPTDPVVDPLPVTKPGAEPATETEEGNPTRPGVEPATETEGVAPPATGPATEPGATKPVNAPVTRSEDEKEPITKEHGQSTTSTTTTAAGEEGGVPVVVIGAAAGGAAAVAAAGLLAAKFAGVGAFGGSSAPPGQVIDNMDVPDAVEDREMMQSIPVDMFAEA